MKFSLVQYELPINWILTARQNHVSWNEIYLCRKANEQELVQFLNMAESMLFWPHMDSQSWKELVDSKKEEEEARNDLNANNSSAIITSGGQKNTLTVPTNQYSTWRLYKRRLLDIKKFKEETVNEIEHSCIRTLNCLSLDTTQTGPIKGMVVGSVQSGKTTNMAGLMAMAADRGWNVFIILTGTIDNLRQQTVKRLYEDLHNGRCQQNWILLNNDLRGVYGQRAQDLSFNNNNRYIIASLKVPSRLKDLLKWLHKDANSRAQMKVLVIEDEADQASINTADPNDPRTIINRLTCNLVNGNDENGISPANNPFKAMNYVAYTATPYANLLNEVEEESLYPRHFITTLKRSNEYFGPQQIFGVEGGNYQGLSITRIVDQNDVTAISAIHNSSIGPAVASKYAELNGLHELLDANGNRVFLPGSLLDAICWFICGVGCSRFWKIKNPISMLVHTNSGTGTHLKLATAIALWLNETTIEDILARCKTLWVNETSNFSKSKFRQQYIDYGNPDNTVKDYPQFEELMPYIVEMLNKPRVSHITTDQSEEPQYHNGIHLCIDNSSGDTLDGDSITRLIYPTKENAPDFCPAFLVVGGTTLSRGLTFEGLISTYFLRQANQADTLMQMGRWFGYRPTYELLPRIWMTSDTIDLFKYLSLIDEELREQIKIMELTAKTPLDYAIRFKLHRGRLKITGAGRSKGADYVNVDFSGTNLQTFMFDKDPNILQGNLDITRDFLINLGDPSRMRETISPNTKVWRGVSFVVIQKFLNDYHFSQRLRGLNDNELKDLLEWIQKMTIDGVLQNWNVVLGTKQESKVDPFEFGNLSANKVSRTLLKDAQFSDTYNIGALRNASDILADIDLTGLTPDDRQGILSAKSKHMYWRQKVGLARTPQLIVYIVDGKSKANEDSETRVSLDSDIDLAGICINIPTDMSSFGHNSTIAIQLPQNDSQSDYTDNN